MKILLINAVYRFGSTGRLVHELKEAAQKEGHEVLVAFGRNPQEATEDTFYFGSKPGFMYHVLMTRFFGRHGLHSTLKTKVLMDRIDAFNPDVIHIHNVHGYYLNVPMLFNYLKTLNKKIIWTQHDTWSVSGSSAYFDYDGCEVWNRGCEVCSNTKEYPEVWAFPNQKRNFKWKQDAFIGFNNLTLITVSDWQKNLLKTTFLDTYEIKRIYNGIDLNVFIPKIKKPPSNTIKLLGVANIWESRKGLDDFILLSKKLPNNYEITLIGLSKEQVNTLPKNIKGITRTDSIASLVKYYQEADIYLNLSVEETMGLTSVEAMACGTPAIVYDKTAVPEIVDANSGIVVEANNIELLTQTIINFDFDYYTIEKARNRALFFNKESMVKSHLELYESC